MGNWCFKALSEPKDDLFTTVPQDIMREILRTLTIKSIMRCKCVCKSWCHLIEEVDFATLHTPEQGLAFALPGHEFKVCDEAIRPFLRVVLPSPNSRCSTYPACTKCDVIDSANGLLLVSCECVNNIFACNPMTHEYVVLPPPPIPMSRGSVIFGFGVSKISGQYKILCGKYHYRSWYCYVYTLGRRGGSWRSLALPALDHPLQRPLVASFLNGNLHWLASNVVCCLDLETELFTSFSLPLCDLYLSQLRVLEDRLYLCLCDTFNNCHIVIWRMNTYADTNSWTEEYTFDNLPHKNGLVYPLKVLANGDLLYAVQYDSKLFICSKNTKTIFVNGLLQGSRTYSCNISVYTPSFLLLATLGIDNVESLK